MAQVSVERMAGQMVISGFSGKRLADNPKTLSLLQNHWLGGLFLFERDNSGSTKNGNIESFEQVKALTSEIYKNSPILPIIAIDEEGGAVNRLKAEYGFLKTHPASDLGKKDDLKYTRRYSSQIADQLKKLGINTNSAPVIDLNINPENPALGKRGRCISEKAETVARHAQVWVKTHHEKGILCTLKHFPGHGSAKDDSHHGIADVTDSWQDSELLPYQSLIAKGYNDLIMTAHIFHKGFDKKYPATLSKTFLTEILRKKMGFRGVIISDDLDMKAISGNYEYSEVIEAGIHAGIDIFSHSNVDIWDDDLPKKLISVILELVQKKRVKPERLLESWQRIQTLKLRIAGFSPNAIWNQR
ncbi:MAG TPA: glycoside hydrolase family 3 protein [Candidatus Marinimicrobia bacterium]|nr:glycoside hydrolase family 3 protein [Candidatus Neomarinimicrobiota bacterium]